MMDPSIPRHPIRVVARRTGLSPATLRAWERRYGVVDPGRSDGNQRLYSDADLERLALLRALTEGGRPISMVAELTDEVAAALLEEDRAARGASRPSAAAEALEDWVDIAYEAVLRLDSPALERALRRASLALESTAFLDDVVTPLLARIGEGWVAGEVSPAQEHLGSNILERVLDWLTSPSVPASDAPRIVVATLPGESHGLGARLVETAAIVEGWRVFYLGTDLPAEEIAKVAREVGAMSVAISLVSFEKTASAVAGLSALREALPDDVDVLVGGRAAGALPADGIGSGVHVLDGLQGLRDRLRMAAV